MSRLTRDGTAEPVSRDQLLRREQRGQEMFNFHDHLTTSRVGNLTRLIHTLTICVTIQYSTRDKFESNVTIMMTKEGTFTMISRVVIVRHLGGLLCPVGRMVSLFNLSSLHPWGS